MASTHQHPRLITTSIQKHSSVSFPFCSKVEGMDQFKSHKIKVAAMTQSIKAHKYTIRLTQVLVSVSLFSIIFPSSTLLAFLHQFNFYFSTFPLQLFTHTIDKNCMFLLCNGLLVFVGITRSFSGSSGVDEPSKYIEDGSHYQYSDVEANERMLVVEKEVEKETSELDEQNTEAHEAIEINYYGKEVEENIENIIMEDEEEVKKSGISVLKEEEEPEEEEEEEEEKESEIDEILDGENVEEEEVVEEENWVLSTEELNKKFDDFIRRMKEDLRIEARRQLVIV